MTELKKRYDILHSDDKSGNTLLIGRNEVLKDFRESGKIFPETNDKNIHTLTRIISVYCNLYMAKA